MVPDAINIDTSYYLITEKVSDIYYEIYILTVTLYLMIVPDTINIVVCARKP